MDKQINKYLLTAYTPEGTEVQHETYRPLPVFKTDRDSIISLLKPEHRVTGYKVLLCVELSDDSVEKYSQITI